MSEVAPRAAANGYVHPDIQAIKEYKATIAQLPLPMRRGEYVEQCSRDVSGAIDEPVAEVFPDSRNEYVHFRLDARTAAAVIHAVRLKAADDEAAALEARLASEAFPVNSYGRNNRMEIALRRERLARRRRALDTAYRNAIDKQWHGV